MPPTTPSASKTSAGSPRSARVYAAVRPAGPAPSTAVPTPPSRVSRAPTRANRIRRLGKIPSQPGRLALGFLDDEVAAVTPHDPLDVRDLVARLDREAGRVGAQFAVLVDGEVDLIDAVELATLAEDAHRPSDRPEGLVDALDLVVHLPEEGLVPADPLRPLVHAVDATPLAAEGVPSARRNSCPGGCHGGEVASVSVRVGEGRRSPLLEGPEGARRAGGRIRGHAPAVPQEQARPRPAGERPAELPGDPVRGRQRLPRGVEGHGREDPRGQALRGARADGFRPARRVASRAVADDTGELAAEHLRKLLLVTDAALSLLPLERLLDELLVRIRDVLDADTAAFLLLDPDANELVARAAKGIEEEVERGVRIPLGRGFAGRVAAQVAPVVIEDVDRADIFNPILREKGIKSLLGAPLTVSGDVIGVVHVGTLTHRAFTPDDVDVLERVAERAALAIEHERLFEAERAATERLHKLLLVTDAALSHLSLNALLDELLLRIRDILEADTVAFLMLDETRGDLVARAAKGIEEEVERGVRIPLGRGFAGRIAAERAPVVIEDVDHGEVLNPILREKGIKSLLGVPLLARGRVLGVVHVGMLRPRHFTPEDVELMQRAAERGALGVERALLYEELRHLDAVRHQFISIASHELRTPAAAVYGAAVTLHVRRDELTPEQVEMLQETIHEQSSRLARLIEQLLDLSRLQAHAVEINPERVRIGSRLEGILELFADSSDLKLEVPEDLEADVDPVVLDRVVTNLVINAFRHGAPPVVVSARRVDRHLRIFVDDDGPGVPEELRSQLFEHFTRGGTTGPGSGLGLAIARSYALAHGGDLLYHPRSPAGSRFELVLPQSSAAR